MNKEQEAVEKVSVNLEHKANLVQMVRQRIDLTCDAGEQTIYETIDEVLSVYCVSHYLTMKERKILKRQVFNSLKKLDILQELVEDESITEIMINGANNIFIERGGGLYRTEESFESEEKLQDIIQQIVAKSNRIINESNPIVDARLEDGSRVNVVLPPVALDGAAVTIRKFPANPITMEQLIAMNSITREVSEFLHRLVVAGYNIFISGGTGSGKTTFLNVLSNFIPNTERIITIEDSAELQIKNVPNLVRLEVKNANVEGKNAITIRSLIKSSLRMRPDRIIVGEVRDEAAIDMLQALNTGHDGSLSTGHANSPADMLSRLESLVLLGADIPLLAVRKQIASAIDIIVHLGRLRDRSRRVLEISEVLDCVNQEIQIKPLYQFIETGQDEQGHVIGELVKQNELLSVDKLKKAGLCSDETIISPTS